MSMFVRIKPNTRALRRSSGLGLLFVVLSLGLHGVLLWLPLPDMDTAEAPVYGGQSGEWEDESIVQVTALPALEQPAPEPVSEQPPERPPAKPPAQPTAPQRPSAPIPPQPTVPETQLWEEPADPPSTPEADSPAAPEAEEAFQPTPEPEPTDVPPPPPTLTERLLNPGEYVYNRETRPTEQATADFLAWFNTASEQHSGGALLLSNQVLPPLEVAYPLSTCLPLPPAVGRFGIVVNAQGQLDRDPELLASTGYDVLDQKAFEQLLTYPMPQATVPTAYGLEIVVNYDANACNAAGGAP